VLRPKTFRSGMLRPRVLEMRGGDTQGAETWDLGDVGDPEFRRMGMSETQDVEM